MSGQTWRVVAAPIIRKCEVATKFKCDAVFNARGAEALGKLVKEMADKLDAAVALQKKPVTD